ncbi:MAG: hypothetical protein ABII96_02255 [Candidatus Zixiibacteriota bacterium]
MQRIMKHTWSVLLLGLIFGVVLGLVPSYALGVDFGLYQINFLGATYDPGANATMFTYQGIAAVNYGFDDWQLELNPTCFGAGDILDASEPYLYVGPDPMTGIYGIKFTAPYGPGETRIVWFRFRGNLTTILVRVALRWDCTYWSGDIPGPQCGGQPGPPPPPPPPPSGQGKSPGYWKNNLAVYLGLKNGNLNEPNVAAYAAQYGYTPQAAYQILDYGGTDMVVKLHRQVLAAKLSTAAGYLTNATDFLEWGQYMVAHPGEFTPEEIEDAKDLFESLHD